MVDKFIAFESGEMSDVETIKFFSELIKTGIINSLQGSYQRLARQLVFFGHLSENGHIQCYERGV